MGSIDLAKVLSQIEELARAGRSDLVRLHLSQIKWNRLPRKYALPFAAIAGRIGDLKRAYRILSPIVLPVEKQALPATPEETIQHANTLRKLGALDAAANLLRKIDHERYPEAALHLGFCHSTKWEYDKAIPFLELYIRASSRTADEVPYSVTVAKVNLLAALTSVKDFIRAKALAAELLLQLDETQSPRLLGNVVEISAQLDIESADFDSAIKKLKRAQALLRAEVDSHDAVYIEKWLAVAESLKVGKVSDELLVVRERASKLEHFETLRDCEFWIARLRGDNERLMRLYFGTPHAAFKERVLSTLGFAVQVPDTYLWQCEGPKPGPTPERIFDLRTAAFDDGTNRLKPGQALHSVLILLCSDFYRPIPLLTIFSRLFENEFFRPDTSPNRVYQIFKRLRAWSNKNRLPWKIEEVDGGYRLVLRENVAIRVPAQSMEINERELEFQSLTSKIKEAQFTTEQAALALRKSRTATQRLLKWAADQGKIVSIGRASRTKYQFNDLEKIKKGA